MTIKKVVQIKQLEKIYLPGSENQVHALRGIDLTITAGEFSGVVGPSGSGKTTLLNIIGLLDKPSGGSVEVLGFKAEQLSAKQAARIRREHMGFIFQTYNLLPVYTVFENVEFPLLLLKWPKKKREQAVWQALEWVNLSDKARSKPDELSGGQAQRVAIARAVVKKPALILADEPTANLDAENSYHILDLMVWLNEHLQTTFLFSTHDEKVIRYLRRVIRLEDGKVTADKSQQPRRTEKIGV